MPIGENAYIGKQVVQKHIEQAAAEILRPDEVLLGAFHGQPMSAEIGRYKGGLSLHHYLLVTDSRVIFWGRGLIAASTDGFHHEDISSVEEARGLLLGEIVLNVHGAKERMRSMVKDDVPKAAQLIRDQIMAHRRAQQGQTASQESVTDTIRKLAELHDAGILTDAEFQTKKDELLKRL